MGAEYATKKRVKLFYGKNHNHIDFTGDLCDFGVVAIAYPYAKTGESKWIRGIKGIGIVLGFVLVMNWLI